MGVSLFANQPSEHVRVPLGVAVLTQGDEVRKNVTPTTREGYDVVAFYVRAFIRALTATITISLTDER